MSIFLPYVDGYGQIGTLFAKIKEAPVPEKFTQNFLETMLGLKSSTFRAMIPLIKKLGLIDSNNLPTEIYAKYRDPDLERTVLAEQIKHAYSEIYKTNEFAHKLSKQEIGNKLVSLLGLAKDDPQIGKIVGTFSALVELADFENRKAPLPKRNVNTEMQPVETAQQQQNTDPAYRFGLGYTININLPSTKDPEVYDAIFKSLKQYLLK